MSIWDTIKVEDDNRSEQPRGNESFVIQYGTETVRVECQEDLTLEQAISKYAGKLGYAPGRAVTFRNGQDIVSPSQKGDPGVRYMASVQLETKGL